MKHAVYGDLHIFRWFTEKHYFIVSWRGKILRRAFPPAFGMETIIKTKLKSIQVTGKFWHYFVEIDFGKKL